MNKPSPSCNLAFFLVPLLASLTSQLYALDVTDGLRVGNTPTTNTVGTKNAALGASNTLTPSTYTMAIGSSNVDWDGATACLMVGVTNTFENNNYYSALIGQLNGLLDSQSMTLSGYGNVGYSSAYSLLAGQNNQLQNSTGATLLGYNNSVKANSSLTAGQNLLNQSLGATVLGQYNLLLASETESGTPSATTWRTQDSLFVVGKGTSSGARSNAFLIRKDGSADLAGALTIGGVQAITKNNISSQLAGVNVGGLSTMSISANGTIGATGSISTMNSITAGGSINATGAITSSSSITGASMTTGGTLSAANFKSSSAGTPLSGALMALGTMTTASGDHSLAIGSTAQTSQPHAVAIGFSAKALRDSAVAIGRGVEVGSAAPQGAVALGRFNVQPGANDLLVVGNGTSTTVRSNAMTLSLNGDAILANSLGVGTTNAVVQNGFAAGASNTVMGLAAAAIGTSNQASSPNSVTLGKGLNSNASESVVVGRFNADAGTDGLFVVGKGIDTNTRSNAMVVKSNGDVTVTGALFVVASGDLGVGGFQ